jgi:hypothetical protein
MNDQLEAWKKYADAVREQGELVLTHSEYRKLLDSVPYSMVKDGTFHGLPIVLDDER